MGYKTKRNKNRTFWAKQTGEGQLKIKLFDSNTLRDTIILDATSKIYYYQIKKANFVWVSSGNTTWCTVVGKRPVQDGTHERVTVMFRVAHWHHAVWAKTDGLTWNFSENSRLV